MIINLEEYNLSKILFISNFSDNKESSSLLENYFWFLNDKNELIPFDILYGNELFFEGKKLNLEIVKNEIMRIKYKYELLTGLKMSNITFSKEVYVGSVIPSHNVAHIPMSYLYESEVNDFSFTIGHELGHVYLYEKNFNFNHKILNYLLPFNLLYLYICFFSIEEFILKGIYNSLDILMFFLLVFIHIINTYILLTVFKRFKNYEIEMFCDDFSCFINNKLYKNYNFQNPPLYSSSSHPCSYLRIKKMEIFSNLENLLNFWKNEGLASKRKFNLISYFYLLFTISPITDLFELLVKKIGGLFPPTKIKED